MNVNQDIVRQIESLEERIHQAKQDFDLEVIGNIYFSPAERQSQWNTLLENIRPLVAEIGVLKGVLTSSSQRNAERLYRHLLNKKHKPRKSKGEKVSDAA